MMTNRQQQQQPSPKEPSSTKYHGLISSAASSKHSDFRTPTMAASVASASGQYHHHRGGRGGHSHYPDLLTTPTGFVMLDNKVDFHSPRPHARPAIPRPASLLPGANSHSPLRSPSTPSSITMRTPPSPSLGLPMACNFEALSQHFHLPLKVAAEKFGVRATAFKKRCRAIGIRHWPYRKVRSLKRSLQELSRCRDQGILNDKQHHQLVVFQSQLDKLLSPETYGIDPSGRLPPGAFDDDDENDHDSNGDFDDDDDTASCASSNQSPRVDGYATFSDFRATPLRPLKRQKKHHPSHHVPSQQPQRGPSHLPTKMRKPATSGLKRDFALPSGIHTRAPTPPTPGTPSPHSSYYFASEESPPHGGSGGVFGTSLHGLNVSGDAPSVSVRFATHAPHSLASFDAYDPFFQDFKSEFTLTMEDFGGDDHSVGIPTMGSSSLSSSTPGRSATGGGRSTNGSNSSTGGASYGADPGVGDDFFPFIRSPTMAAIRASAGMIHCGGSSVNDTGSSSRCTSRSASTTTSNTDADLDADHGDLAYGSMPDHAGQGAIDDDDDDVFLQISPDYGCLV